ncbi:MAG: class I SAM-dependent methyltransferase [Gammaproteobacteria bacterium]|nr:class I SAM-dependent methyltransferase [Gammaproteobacteria bacterium]
MNYSKKTWQNTDNIDWYENIPVESLRDLAIRGGIENGCDIDIIYPYIEKTKLVIEIGSGYGRAIRRLIEKGYQGKIHTLERSKNFIRYLSEHFQSIDIIEAEIATYVPPVKYDAIIGVWSFIAEFPVDEQLDMIKHLSHWLNDNGILILETLATTPLNATNTADAFYEIGTPYGTVWGHMPTQEQVCAYAKAANLKIVQLIEYKTSTDRARVLYILSR